MNHHWADDLIYRYLIYQPVVDGEIITFVHRPLQMEQFNNSVKIKSSQRLRARNASNWICRASVYSAEVLLEGL